MAGAAAVLSLVLSLPFLFVLARRPILRRLAFRNTVRRPREALLVVAGSMLGAAIITGSFVVGDAMNASIRQVARSHLGPVDELVSARDRSSWQELGYRLQKLPRDQVDGVLPIATMEAAVTAEHDGRVVAAPHAQVVGVDFAAARTFGGNAQDTGISGPAPDEGHAAIGADLARKLGVGPGALIDVNAYGTRTMLFVDRVLPRRGVAGFWLGIEQESRNVIVSPSAFDAIRAISGSSAAPPSWYVAVSNRGGVESGVGRTEEVKASIERLARGVGPGGVVKAPQDLARGLEPQVLPAKRTMLDAADATGKGFTEMFTSMGSFGVLAGLLLLVQLFVMLAAERKPELGMARAVGMRRGWLVGAFATEGWLYAVVATAVGTAVGVGLGRILVAFSARIFNSEHSQFDLFFVLRPASLVLSFTIAFAIALVTIVATSVRVSRLNIIRAIRDIPEPPGRRRRRWLVLGGFLAVLGAAWTLSAVQAESSFGLLLGPTIFLIGIAPTVARLAPARTAISLMATAVVAWSALVLALFPDAAEGASVMLFVAQGIVLTAGAVVLATMQQDRFGAALRHVGARALSVRLGLAYPLARRGRTGLTVAMYALVVFILTFITTISHMIGTQTNEATASVRGGYDVVLSSSSANPVPPAELAQVRGVTGVAPIATTTANFFVGGSSDRAQWHLTAFDRSFVDHGPPDLEDRGSYPTDAAAWRAVLRDPNLIIVDSSFLQDSGGPPDFKAKPGAKITVEDPISGRRRVVTVAAVSPPDYYIYNGALYGRAGARAIFGDKLVPSRFYLATAPGVDAELLASSLQGRFLDNGADAVSIDAMMDEAFTMTNQIFQLFEGYLAMGLLVGIAGIAVVMIRAVRERRRPIGTLRAIGFSGRTIGRSFAIESGFVAVEGTVLGVMLALLTLYTLVSSSDAMGDLAFSVPYVPLGLLLLGTVVASLLATVAPAISASRIRPAVALRLTD